MRFLLLFVTLITISSAWAGEKTYSKRFDKTEILAASDLSLSLPVFTYGSHESNYYGKVTLSYNRELQSDLNLSDEWRFKVDISQTIGTTTNNYSLLVSNEDGNSIYSDYQIVGVQQTVPTPLSEITVTGVTTEYYNGSAWVSVSPIDPVIPNDIDLTYALITERHYEVDHLEKTILRIEEEPNTLYAKWHFMEGAEEYDLEWVTIEEGTLLYDDIQTALGSGTYDPALPFDSKEGTSVRVLDTKYEIDKVFPEGIVFFRVRGVGRHIGAAVNGDYSYIFPGEWSYHSTTLTNPSIGHLASINIQTANNAFEEGKTWTYGIGFAEEGKFASTVSYFDGSLRSRQTTAYNNTDDVTLKSESLYDSEGRMVVGTSPAPVAGRDLTYEAGFNTVLNGSTTEKFDKSHFEIESPLPLTADNGMGAYFSQNNTFDQINQGAIPTSQGYLYSQVRFLADGTGRVKQAAGIGDVFAMDKSTDPLTDRTTYYHYGSALPVELERLFGNKISDDINYYRKNMVKDPNGQLSVAYTDAEGRTIATGLAGPSPDNLVGIDGSAGSSEYTTSLNSGNDLVNNDLTLESKAKYINAIAGNTLDILYDFNGVIYEYDSETPRCQDCKYILEITVIDPNGYKETYTTPIDYTSFFRYGCADVS